MHTFNHGENTVTDEELLVLYVTSCSSKDPDYEEKKRIAALQAAWHRRKDKKLIRFAMEEAAAIDDCESVWACDAKIDELYDKWLKTQSS